MRRIELDAFMDVDLEITNRHFGGNILYTKNTDDGQPDPNFVVASDKLDIQYIRYPAGQPDVAYANGVIIDGYLPDHLVNFLESARVNNWKVLIVTPTHEAYPGASDIGDFAYYLARDYSDVIHAIEIGNEYWYHQTETSYGRVANDSILEISSALNAAQVDIPIWVQMGDAGGIASEFHSKNDSRGWISRTIDANETLINQISSKALLEIDGVVEHFYLRERGQYIDIADPNDQMIGLDFAIWQNYLADDATLNITEWNIRSTNLDQLGIRAASSLIAHFSHIVQLGADEAYIWPPHLNTSSDLAGSGDVIVDPETGIVINSVGGAIFDMMSSSLPGLEYLPSGIIGESGDVIHHLYGGTNRVVVYLSSRSEEIETVEYSLGEFFDGFSLSSALRVGYDHSTSNGRHYNYITNSWDDSEFVFVRGEEYVVNEHDVRASIEVLDIANARVFEGHIFELLPYQVIELVYEIPEFHRIEGGDQHDTIFGTDADDWISVKAGNDRVTAGRGADTVNGGLGDDYINSGNGDDSVNAGEGNDSLRGWGGDDTLLGGAGDDRIDGSSGKDSLLGGSGDDTISGGDWHDTLFGELGDDVMVGGKGNDLMHGGKGNDFVVVGRGHDTVDGGGGQDVLSFSDAVEKVTIWSARQVAEVGKDLVSFKDFEVVETTDFNDSITIANSAMEFIGLGGDDYVFLFDGIKNNIIAGNGDDAVYVHGGSENSILGGNGSDFFFVLGEGNDFDGGPGDDEFLFFNVRADTITYFEGGGYDTVRGFNIHQDVIRLPQALESELSILHEGNNSIIAFGRGGSIELIGINSFGLSDIEFF